MWPLMILWACRSAPAPAVSGLSTVDSDLPGGGNAPLVVAVHGLGDVPESLLNVVRRCNLPVHVVAPRGPIVHGDGWSWFDVRFSEGGATVDGAGVAAAADQLSTLIRQLSQRDDVVGKPVLTGFSQGGILSFAVALRAPELLKAAIPVSGALPLDLEPADPAPAGAPPIRALHGDSDPVVPVGPTRDLVHRLETHGWDATIRVFPRVGHAIPEAVHANLCEALARAVVQ